MNSGYDRRPVLDVDRSCCVTGWQDIAARIAQANPRVICVECYPGVFSREIEQALVSALQPARVFRSGDCFRPPAEIDAMLDRYLGSDPVFGRMNGSAVGDFFDPGKLAAARDEVRVSHGRILVIGTGAALVAPVRDVLVYADIARWEIQKRFRAGEYGNLGADNASARASLKYKRAFFVDWRAADRLKKNLLSELDFLLDTNDRHSPKLISRTQFRSALAQMVRRPFRLVPFFDPGPWGGQWMRRAFGLPDGPPNYAWCFDCVPEENSILFGFANGAVEIPAIDLVYAHPGELLGEAVHARFGTEFPIRFDLLDTMEGGNLSLQVHPLTEYIQDTFGMPYTQDESYYLLDASDGACVYLGLKEGINPAEMLRQLERGPGFAADRFVNRWPARKHDHFLIPGGTVHCSGRNSMVLEISATPYIFTFKLWDWERLDLEGRPRPIHLEHGRANIQWDRTTEWVRRELVNRIEPVAAADGWREERTGLHLREFIETRRHWFTSPVEHHTQGGLNVLNLVEGEAAVVESPANAFEPYTVHYAETFVLPAAAGAYTIRPAGPFRCATIKAFVRTNP